MGSPLIDGGYRVLNAKEMRSEMRKFEIRRGIHCSKEKWKAMQNFRKKVLPSS